MDCSEIKVEMAEEEGLLEPLFITEDGDISEGFFQRGTASGSVVLAPSSTEESEEHKADHKNEENQVGEKIDFKQQSPEKQQNKTEEEQNGEVVVKEDDKQGTENSNDGHNGGDSESKEQACDVTRITEKMEKMSDTEDGKVSQNDPEVNTKSLDSSEKQSEGIKSPDEDLKKVHRLTPDFPESLYDLLCTLQEGRRLNDQRCSFSLETSGIRRRRCHSEPNTNKPTHRVMFSSMTSLQKEEFFELVATAQARRLDDQRAQLERSPPTKSKSRSFRGSIKQLSFVRRPVPTPAPAPVPVPVPKEDLYNMILTTQSQGRLEDQRSRAPGPMDDEDFFSLLLRVQGGRMEEQRTELPCMLQT